MKIAYLILLAVVTCACGLANATIVEVRLEGIVTDANLGPGFSLDGSVVPGSPMSVFFRYDTLAPDDHPGDNNGGYDMLDITLTVGNYTFAADPTGLGSRLLVGFGADYYSLVAGTADPLCDGTVFQDGVPMQFDEVDWGKPVDVGFSLQGPHLEGATDAIPLPETFPPLSFFTAFRGMGVGIDEDAHTGIYGEITSLVVVPEPGTVALLSLGGLVAFRRRRSR